MGVTNVHGSLKSGNSSFKQLQKKGLKGKIEVRHTPDNPILIEGSFDKQRESVKSEIKEGKASKASKAEEESIQDMEQRLKRFEEQLLSQMHGEFHVDIPEEEAEY